MATLEDSEKIKPDAQKETITDPADGESGQRLDDAFTLLASAQRRYLLYYLSSMEGAETTLERAVEAVEEYEPSAESADSLPTRQRIRLSLVHDHLPRLVAADVLEYDTCDGTIRYDGTGSLGKWLAQTASLELD